MPEIEPQPRSVVGSVQGLSEACARSVRELISAAVANRVALSIERETLKAVGPRSVANLGRELMERKAEVVAWLSAWQPEAVSALEQDTDGLVERLGGNGTDDVIRAAAARCVLAHYASDTLGVVAACQTIQARARELAERRSEAA